MDLLQLEHFLAVVEEGSFTRAAERVSRTQPALSQSIKKLEDELGTPLFARDLPGVSLTDAGAALLEHACRLVRARDAAVREVTALKHFRSGAITIAAHESAVYLLPAPLRAYLARFPDVRIRMSASQLADIPRQVLDREAHVGFVENDPRFDELACVPVHTDEMIVVASPKHHLAGRPVLDLGDLENEPFVLHPLSSATQQWMLRTFDQHRKHCRVVAELWSFETLKTFVQQEVGLAFVPGITVAQELRDGRLVRLLTPVLEMPRQTWMIYPENGHISDAVRELIALVRTFTWSGEAAA